MGHLAQRSVLVVEDEVLIAMELEDALTGAGCSPVRLAATVSDALRALSEAAPDVAVLDVSVSGDAIYPVADALADISVPYVLLTGHSVESMPERMRGRPVLPKPYDPRELLSLLADVIEAGRHGGR
jgi:DNA-binding NtrC family response regulator